MKKWINVIITLLLFSCSIVNHNIESNNLPTTTPIKLIFPSKWNITATKTITLTNTNLHIEEPSKTPNNVSLTHPILYQGTPEIDDQGILFMESDECKAMSVSTYGGGAIPVTKNTPDDCSSAEISPDGKQLAYIGIDKKSSVYFANIDGSESKVVISIPPFENVTPEQAWNVKYSPTGKQLVIVTQYPPLDGYGDLYLINTDGSGGLKHIFINPLDRFYPPIITWSPDGNWLFYYCMGCNDVSGLGSPPDNWPIAYHIVDAKYSSFIDDISNISDAAGENPFEWSLDSKSLAFITVGSPQGVAEGAYKEKQQAVFVATIINEKEFKQTYIPLPLLDLPEDQGAGWDSRIGIRWSPDGSTFLAMQRFTRQLTILRKDGTIQKTFLALSEVPLSVDWSPDGKWIYFILPGSTPEDGGFLEIIRPDGTDMRLLANGVTPGSVVWKKNN
jgi:Tol biopolymer transport system component